ncbi:MAG: hypothetical protein U1F71_02145 [Verrucomicrobiaceae bacterium]
MTGFLYALAPLVVGLLNICLLKGWILIRPQDRTFSEDWVRRNRRLITFLAIIPTIGGIGCILLVAGVISPPVVPR